MARRYAAIMALVGMSVTLVRALRNGSTVEATVVSALAWMAGLGLVGLVTAAIASATIEESVRTQMERELAQQGAA
ncbi:MAG TPA: hypothetical protein VEQ85_10265 [Lacipirellulaceae bacterium]|nr:hypothetical protein [Lacipirellulaceae bacterium]